MDFPKECKIEKIVGKDASLPLYHAPYLMREDDEWFILATNERNGVRIPVVCTEHDVAGPVPLDAIKQARKLGVPILCGATHCVVQDTHYSRAMHYTQFPRVDHLVPTGKVAFSINVRELYEMANALGSDICRVNFSVVQQGDVKEVHAIGLSPHPHASPREGTGWIVPYTVDPV